MKWAVRIIPVRKDNAGNEIKLEAILESILQSPWMQVGQTIEQKDLAEFEKAYKFTLGGCYSCHKAADKPYLRPQVPQRPATSIMMFVAYTGYGRIATLGEEIHEPKRNIPIAIINLAAIRLTDEERLYPRFIRWCGLLSCIFLAAWVESSIWIIGILVLAIGLIWQHLAPRKKGTD